MEQAEIDWKNIVSHYELDEVYERINAPKWIDFTAPDAAVDDVAWFCRPDCRHPITYEDFDRWNPSPKVQLCFFLSDSLFSARNSSSLTLHCLIRISGEAVEIQFRRHSRWRPEKQSEMRGGIASFFPSPSQHKLNSRKVSEDLENQNPNMETTSLMMKAKKIKFAVKKEPIKSSAEKKGGVAEDELRETQRKISPPRPRLKSTFSARNLFSGKDILSQISEFCHELKKLAAGKDSAAINEEEKKDRMRKTLEEDGKAASKENAEEENALISTIKTTSLKKKCKLAVKFEGNEEKKSKILKEARAHPPTPQRFPSPSSHHHELKSSKAFANSISSSSPLSKIPKSKSPGRGALQELDQRREKKKLELTPKSEEECNRASVVSEAEEESTVDLFWFLKSCTYLS
ncbi:hypothetical protein IEQ34_003068 [Dendrobium chrysotoxum]|uniref:Uncharacterized protein n=1 Tax=Dendrobium chrysotoxum TaxID=161865 RepID=A0AAV7HL29_DENCH|nr:hypothetical protein IEQ34_003068 [Dendrobium chrysotoxum]